MVVKYLKIIPRRANEPWKHPKKRTRKGNCVRFWFKYAQRWMKKLCWESSMRKMVETLLDSHMLARICPTWVTGSNVAYIYARSCTYPWIRVCVCVSINKIPYSLTWIFNNATQRQAACCIGKISQNIHFNFICFFRTSFTFSFSLFYFPLPFVLYFSFICYGFHLRVDFFVYILQLRILLHFPVRWKLFCYSVIRLLTSRSRKLYTFKYFMGGYRLEFLFCGNLRTNFSP